jgi:hypothetical protein
MIGGGNDVSQTAIGRSLVTLGSGLDVAWTGHDSTYKPKPLEANRNTTGIPSDTAGRG